MQRVLIIGSPGAGKSTLAKALAVRTGLPLVHLDDLYHQPGADWVPVDRAVWRERLQEALDGELWIMDGNYGSTLEQRAARADTILFLTPPRLLCLYRILRRELSGKHPHRHGLKRRLPGWEFVRYTWQYPRKIQGMYARLGGQAKVVTLRSDAEVRRWLATLR